VKVAGVRSGNEKYPSFVAVVVRTKPFASSRRVTLTRGTAAPIWSWILPEREHEVF
jgi:hypothetical protein